MATASWPRGLLGGCLYVIFGGCFTAVGVVMAGMISHDLWGWSTARGWEPTPAEILDAQLVSSSGGRGGPTYRVTARYRYQSGGQVYTSDRVAVSTGSDNIGHFWKDLYKQLKVARDHGQSVTCYVNPARPEQALLCRELRPEMLAFQGAFVLTFGSFGLVVLIGAPVAWARERRRQAILRDHPDEPWRARPDWAAGRIASDELTVTTVTAVMILSGFVLGIPGTLALSGPPWVKWVAAAAPVGSPSARPGGVCSDGRGLGSAPAATPGYT
jgi:Protein of unknown function (DUF3592)